MLYFSLNLKQIFAFPRNISQLTKHHTLNCQYKSHLYCVLTCWTSYEGKISWPKELMLVIKDVKFPPFSEHKDSYLCTLTVTIDYLCSQFFHPVLLLFLLHTPHYRPIMRRIQLWSCPLLCLSSWTSMLNLSWVRHWIYPANPEGIPEKQIDQISHQMKLKVTVPCHWL